MKQRDDWHLTDAIHHDLGSGDPFAAAVRATRMAMMITDGGGKDNPIVFCNEAFQQLTGYAREDLVGRDCRMLQGPETDSATIAQLREAVRTATPINVDILNYRKDGTSFWNALYMSPVRNAEGEVQFFFASLINVTERVEAQADIARQKANVEREVVRRTADLEAALEAKSLLLHEVDHRVKNNLTMIGSLLRLQARSIEDPIIASKLEAMLERVDALSTVHRLLYQSEDITRFDLGAFVANLVSDVVGSSGRNDISIETDVAPIDLPSSKATALGLVVNEVITNAIKHGFADGRPGILRVSARTVGGGATIMVRDDGHGMAEPQPMAGMGRSLITRLSRQVGASAAWSDASPGTCVTLTLPIGE